jgi:hypothetical protein
MKNGSINDYKYKVDVQFAHLLDTLLNVERLFDAETAKYKAHMMKESNKLLAVERQAYLDDYSSELWFIEYLIPSKIRTSILISCYSTFEYELLRICKTISRNNAFPVTLNDLKGKGVFLAQTYLEKVARVTILDKDDAWSHIAAFNTIRNMIVHNNERFNQNHPKADYISKYIGSHKDIVGDIVIDEDGYFEISYNYAYFILHLMQGWYQDLFENKMLVGLMTNRPSEQQSNDKPPETKRAENEELSSSQ